MGHNGLVLSGGGARTAFQVGVFKAMSEWLPDTESPFKVISGVSAGSINATYLASNADQFKYAVDQLVSMWRTLRTKEVYNSTVVSSNRLLTLFKVLKSIRKDGSGNNSILNAKPLAQLLAERIDFKRVQYCLDNNFLHSVAITATNFHESMSTTFVQSNTGISWDRARREGITQKVKIKHIMASSAIPFLFSPVKIKQHFYGDGSLRNIAPLSPAIRCGADNLVVIGVREIKEVEHANTKENISFGDIFSKVLNTILFDSLDIDYERLSRINHTISNQNNSNHTKLKQIQSIIIRPSINLCDIVKKYHYESPPVLEDLLKLIGTNKNGEDLRSYLLFEPGYLSELIDQGYKDAQPYKNKILELINKKALE